jgi:hypothetical protein
VPYHEHTEDTIIERIEAVHFAIRLFCVLASLSATGAAAVEAENIWVWIGGILSGFCVGFYAAAYFPYITKRLREEISEEMGP